jgi:hypothetical protein
MIGAFMVGYFVVVVVAYVNVGSCLHILSYHDNPLLRLYILAFAFYLHTGIHNAGRNGSHGPSISADDVS